MLTAACVVVLILDAVYNILFERNQARRAWNNSLFWPMFWACVLTLALGVYFAYHCFELLSEQLESISENQSFIDDLKEQYGTPVPLW